MYNRTITLSLRIQIPPPPLFSIESSVRCPTTENLILGKQHQASDFKYEMRDLYNRKVKLKRWIQRIHTDLKDNEPDKQDILKNLLFLNDSKKVLFIVFTMTIVQLPTQ